MDWKAWAAPIGAFSGFVVCAQAVVTLDKSRQIRKAGRLGVDRITAVCYLFCLIAYLTGILGAWLIWSKQVDTLGQPTSVLARYAFLIAGESINFSHELIVVGVLLSVVIVPQLMNYLVAGLFGAAGTTKFGAWCLRFAFWTIVKGFAVAGGVSVAWGLIAMICHWPKAYESSPSELTNNGVGQMASAAIGTLLAGPLEDRSLAAMRSRLAPLTRRMRPVHHWLTRNVAKVDDVAIE